MRIYWPARNFATVSVTGERCELMCSHCQGRFLRHMAAAETPLELWELALEEKAKGTKGMLISGGADKTGAVPILKYLDIIKKIKDELNISINLHTGHIAIRDIHMLAAKGIDVISFDIVGSQEALRNVYGIELEPGYYDMALEEFTKHGLRVVPHVTVGLDQGNDSGEEEALQIIARHEPEMMVINALMSARGEEGAGKRLQLVLEMARKTLPEGTGIGIGCMRPRGQRLDAERLADTGVVSIALPSKSLLAELKSMGIEVKEMEGCCALF